MRAFQDREVSQEKLDTILRAANRAPSAGDLQAYSIVVVRKPEARQALAQAAVDQQFVAEAPVVLVFLADPKRSGEKYGHRGEGLYAIQDAAIACAYAQLAAHDVGLTACWVGAFRKKDVHEIVGGSGGPGAACRCCRSGIRPRSHSLRRVGSCRSWCGRSEGSGRVAPEGPLPLAQIRSSIPRPTPEPLFGKRRSRSLILVVAWERGRRSRNELWRPSRREAEPTFPRQREAEIAPALVWLTIIAKILEGRSGTPTSDCRITVLGWAVGSIQD